MGIKFYDSNGKHWGEYDETRNLFIPSEEPITKTETQNSNLTFDTPQTEETCERCVYVRGSQWCQGCNGTPKKWDGEKIVDTPQTEEYDFRDEQEYNDRCQTDCAWMYDSRRDYEYDKALDEMERNFIEFEEYDDGEDEEEN